MVLRTNFCFFAVLLKILKFGSTSENFSYPSMFISNEMLAYNPLNTLMTPECELIKKKSQKTHCLTFLDYQTCDLGKIFYWPSVPDLLPWVYIYSGNIPYIVFSNSSCDMCFCSTDNSCYKPVNKANYIVRFLPFCNDNACYMYTQIAQYPFYPSYNFQSIMDMNNQTVNAPYPYITMMRPDSGYILAKAIGCNGCQVK